MSAPQSDAQPGKDRLRWLPVSQVAANEANPRLIFPQDELDRLAESIELEGILVPIVVYPKDDQFVIVDGERRFRCARTLGHETVPAVVTEERPEHEVLLQMFNIHQIREQWQDMPTAKALRKLIDNLERNGEDHSDARLRDLTGLSIERVKQLRYVTTLPKEWQDFIESGQMPLNFFWEMKRNVIDLMRTQRPDLYRELGEQHIAESLVNKRLSGVITDTVSLRNARPIINFAAQEANDETGDPAALDDQLRSLVNDPNVSVTEAYEDTVQSMVEVDKLEKRTASMLASFSRLLAKAKTAEEHEEIARIGHEFIDQLTRLVNHSS